MNQVSLIGRLTRDPELRQAGENSVCSFTIAVDRPQRQGQEKKADFPRITVFGGQAETCSMYLKKGRLIGVLGRLQTGSYIDKNGNTVYTTDVVANRVEFLGPAPQQQVVTQQPAQYAPQQAPMPQAAPQQPIQQMPPEQYAPMPQAAPAPQPAQYAQAPMPQAPMPEQAYVQPQAYPQAEPDGFEGIESDVPF